MLGGRSFTRSVCTVEAPDMGSLRIAEALDSLRHKSPRATTLERLRVCREVWESCRETAQPRQLGWVVRGMLERIETPVAAHDLLLGRIREEIPDAAGEAWFRETLKCMGRRPPCLPDGGHETFAWERLLRLGLSGLHAEATSRLANSVPEERDFLAGLTEVAEGFRSYARRYGAAARQAGLIAAAAAVEALAERPPATFREALQLVWLVGHVYATMCAVNATLTFGRLDQWLHPFYAADLAAGRLSRAEAGDLIEDFYCKNNLVLGRGEHQMSGGGEFCTGWDRNLCYDAPQYVVLGGTRAPERPDFAELTELFVERVVPRFENPYVVIRQHPALSPRLWRLISAKLRDNASMMIYNDRAVLPAMERAGFRPDEAVEYTLHGCNWPDVPPSQCGQGTHWHSLPATLLQACARLEEAADMDAVYAAFAAAYRENETRELTAHVRQFEQRCAQPTSPLAVDDLFLEGPLERGRDKRHGGVRHPTFVTTFAGLATAVDSLAAIEQVVFVGRVVSWRDFRAALAADFAGWEALRAACRNAPKFGCDKDRADAHAGRLTALLHAVLDELEPLLAPVGGKLFRCVETDMQHLALGKSLGATPDGRRAGAPVSENSSPSVGASVAGLTAMFRSLAKLPFDRCHSGALNVRLQPAAFAGDAGVDRLAALLLAYFRQGGLQAQISMVDVDTLRAAQAQPAEYRDLMVRITGYSAAFVDMTPAAQDEIIRREGMAPGVAR
jgi:formate C-acetyltransferase